jgi:hypothetical protein
MHHSDGVSTSRGGGEVSDEGGGAKERGKGGKEERNVKLTTDEDHSSLPSERIDDKLPAVPVESRSITAEPVPAGDLVESVKSAAADAVVKEVARVKSFERREVGDRRGQGLPGAVVVVRDPA